MTEKPKPTAAEQKQAAAADKAATDTRNTGGFPTASQETTTGTRTAVTLPAQVVANPELVYDHSSPALNAHRVADGLAALQAAKAAGAAKGQGADEQADDIYPPGDPLTLQTAREGVTAEQQARAVRADTDEEQEADKAGTVETPQVLYATTKP